MEFGVSTPDKIIEKAIQRSTKIIFCLDGLKFPINYKIFTYMELFTIIENPKYLKKTQFYLDGAMIRRESVIDQLKTKNEGIFENPKVLKVVAKQNKGKTRQEKRTERQMMSAKKQRSRQLRSNQKKRKVVSLPS